MSPRRPRQDPALLALFEEAGVNVSHGAVLLRDLLADPLERGELAAEIQALEHEGDRITHAIFQRLATEGTGSPRVELADAQALAHALDDVIDEIEEVADQLGLYGVEAPMEQAEGMAAVLVQAAAEVGRALVAQRAGEPTDAHRVEIHRLENEGDRLRRAAVASLFATGVDPMVVIRWKDIFQGLETALDACETVANVLEGIALRTA